MVNRRFTYTEKNITDVVADENGNFVWIAYAQDSEGNCNLKKTSAFSPDQIYFDIDKAVTNINAMTIDTANLYLAFDDSVLLGEILGTSNPLSNIIQINIPVGIVEVPVDIAVDGTDLFFLIPGNQTGTNAKILKYDTLGVLQDTIDLTKTGVTVVNATSFDIADTGDIWVMTNEDPANLVRVFELSGGGFDFTVTPIT